MALFIIFERNRFTTQYIIEANARGRSFFQVFSSASSVFKCFQVFPSVFKCLSNQSRPLCFDFGRSVGRSVGRSQKHVLHMLRIIMFFQDRERSSCFRVNHINSSTIQAPFIQDYEYNTAICRGRRSSL